jgi:hypothetical protein
LPLAGWKDTYATLHMWTRIVARLRWRARAPVSHSWGIAFQLTPWAVDAAAPVRRPIVHHQFDFIDHRLIVRTSSGDVRALALRPQTVALSMRHLMALLGCRFLAGQDLASGGRSAVAVRLDRDETLHAYDRRPSIDSGVSCTIAHVLTATRCSFVGKSSPVHFFWAPSISR